MSFDDKEKGAIFLDRDGVINRAVVKNNKPYAPIELKNFHFYKNLDQYLRVLSKNYYLFIVTNQPDLSQGKQTFQEINKINKYLLNNYFITEISMCIHTKFQNCKCRKPKNYFYKYLLKKYNFKEKKTYTIGDTYADYKFAKNSKTNFFLIKKKYNRDLYNKLLEKNIFLNTRSALKKIIKNDDFL